MLLLVGIAGGTGSGKTSLARKLMARLGEDRCVLVSQESYYKDGRNLSAAARAAINYDHPDAFDLPLLVQDVRDLKAGRPVPQLAYDFATCTRTVLSDPVIPRPVILLEGLLVLAEEPLRRMLNIKLFIDTDADVRVLRRLRRDLRERERSFEASEAQYLSFVRPMHLEFVEPSKRYADLIIPEGAENEVALEAVLARINALLQMDPSKAVTN